jgi:hypothetical protein
MTGCVPNPAKRRSAKAVPEGAEVAQKTTGHPPPEILYHYTTRAGMLGILQNRCLWLSDALYLNDASELTYGYRLINDALRKLETASLPEAASKQMVSGSLPKGTSIKQLTRLPVVSAFVMSFTTRDDDLSQWRGYGGAGDVYCIGFRCSAIKAAATPAGVELAQCLYSKDLQQKLAIDSSVRLKVREMIFGPTVRRGKKSMGQGGRLGALLEVLDGLLEGLGWLGPSRETLPLVVARIKHPAFEAEHECG